MFLSVKNDGDAVVFPAIFTAKNGSRFISIAEASRFRFHHVAKDTTNVSPHGKYLRIWRRGERPANAAPSHAPSQQRELS